MKDLNEIFGVLLKVPVNICSIGSNLVAAPTMKTDILWGVKYLLAHSLTISVVRFSPYNNLTTCLIGIRYFLFNKISLPL